MKSPVSQFLCDFKKLTLVARESGAIHAVKLALLAARMRLLLKPDIRRESYLGVTIRQHAELELLDISSTNKRYGFSYLPSAGRVVRLLLDNVAEDFGKFSFIDVGSGEGRVLLVASALPFENIIGVEFASELHAAAVRNVQLGVPALHERQRITPIHADAAEFEIPRANCILYFCNPFSERVFQRVLKNVEDAHRECAKKMYILYSQTAGDLETNRTNNVVLLRTAPFLAERPVRFPTLLDRFLLASHELYIFESHTVSDTIPVCQCE